MAKIFIHNAETKENDLRNMTAEEKAEFDLMVSTAETMESNRAEAKAALLNKLGITIEEAQLLVS